MLPAPVALSVPVRARASVIPQADGAGGFLEWGWHLPACPLLVTGHRRLGEVLPEVQDGVCGGVNPDCASRIPSDSKDREINVTLGGAWGAPTSRGAHPGEEKTGVKEKLGHIPLIV